jgi:hypothetical protein
MLAADVCKGALEELAELLVGRLERRIRKVDVGHELHPTRPRKHAHEQDQDTPGGAKP